MSENTPNDATLDALRRGDHAASVTHAREAISAAPDDPRAYSLLAMAQAGAGERDAALDSIQRALRLAPDDADLHFQHAGLLLGSGDAGGARAALDRSTGLDPNQFGAYILQAQLALGRGDLDEAERLQKLAARIEPAHPWVRTIEGMLALRRGDAQFAQVVLSQASQDAPDDPQVRYALGFAYMAAGHFAFAEQAFRGVLEQVPAAHALRSLLAELLRRQERFGDAADELAPLLADPALVTPGLQRFSGELHLAQGRHDLALPPLLAAFDAQPQDPRTLTAVFEAWRRAGDVQGARTRLDAALAEHSTHADLWRARLAFADMVDAEGVIARWLATSPDEVQAHAARMALQDRVGDRAGMLETARRIVALEPGNTAAEMRLVDAMLQDDPAAAVTHIETLLAKAGNAQGRTLLRGWLALAQDRAGHHADAAAGWLALQAEEAPNRLPLPTLTAPIGEWPAAPASDTPDPLRAAFLVGAPGSGVERVASLLSATVPAFRGDRFGPTPPGDLLQNYHSPAHLRSGEVAGSVVFDSWRDALPAREPEADEIVDGLLWWDNAFLLALRPALREAPLLIALRDPRDMFLDWLAFGAMPPLRMENAALAAQWLARSLEHVAVLHEQDLFPHALVRMDDADPAELARTVGQALHAVLPEPPAGALGPAKFAAGHWRDYHDALAPAFALLTPVALRLGYAAD